MKKSIKNKIEDYLNYQSELMGERIFFDSSSVSISSGPKFSEELSISNIEHDSGMPQLKLDKVKGWEDSDSINQLYERIHTCQACPLGLTRTKFVFGSGNENADIMIIGEAPGADEDEQGLPFVGKAGQLLTKIIEAIDLKRDEVFIANILKCRPPNNRRPQASEVDECEPYLHKQISLIKPAFILVLGLTAADTLFKSKHKMADARGQLKEYQGIKTLITYHPAALLRNPELKKPVWEDVKLLRKLYDEFLNNK